MWLPDTAFSQIVQSVPIVSIDLVVENSSGNILLGLRTNRPAQGYWFVPGGRIRKNERLDDSFWRISLDELGVEVKRSAARSLGVYEHFYADSIFGDGLDTHYIVLAYHLHLDIDAHQLPVEQHCDYLWWDKEEARHAKMVHENSRAYLRQLL